MESAVSGTGPVPSVMSPMTVDLSFKDKVFAQVDLPEVHCSAGGTAVNVTEQLIKIEDMDAYKAFVRSLTLDERLTLQLRNGKCSIKAMGLTSKCQYAKDVELVGMNGPRIEDVELLRTDDADRFTSKMNVINPSPLEIDHGMSEFQLENEAGETIADLKGELKIIRGTSTLTTECVMRKAVSTAGARLVGRGVEVESWCSETIKNINVPVRLPDHL